MADLDNAALTHALNMLPDRFRGPGGVAGVVHDGQVIARRAWGHADVTGRVPMTPARRMPICSISKHMTCALLLHLFDDPEVLQPLLPALLPRSRGPLPTIAQLCHNQSGLRDYWALTVLHGAAPEGRFTEADGLAILAQMQTGHFAPGSHYSYSNSNFRLLAELISRATGENFSDLLDAHIFGPAAMPTARLSPDMATRIDGVIGYEGNDEVGFLPAKSAITWFGDSGISASLDDLLAWECHIDATRDDPEARYSRISRHVSFVDGNPAPYAYGLRHYGVQGQELTGHGGGVRGFCSYRLHVAARRLSVVVMFNHEASAKYAAEGLMAAALGLSPAAPATQGQGWDGLWLDAERGLLLRTRDAPGGVRLHYAVSPVVLAPAPGDPTRAAAPGVALRRDGDHLVMERPGENLRVRATPLTPVDWADAAAIAGRYHADELGATLEIEARDGAAAVYFSGLLGEGPVERMYPLAADLWTITSRRAMDAAPPGEWTVLVHRGSSGAVTGLTVGCGLAYGLRFFGPQ